MDNPAFENNEQDISDSDNSTLPNAVSDSETEFYSDSQQLNKESLRKKNKENFCHILCKKKLC